MAEDSIKKYPKASTTHQRTGIFAPSLPRCRSELFLWEEGARTGICAEHFDNAHKFSPGAMTLCCGCKHPVVLTFSVLDGKEAPQVLLNKLIKRFLKAPRFLVHDLGCGVLRAALGKIAWLLAYRTIVSGGFHSFDQLCSNLFDPRSYRNTDGVGSGAP